MVAAVPAKAAGGTDEVTKKPLQRTDPGERNGHRKADRLPRDLSPFSEALHACLLVLDSISPCHALTDARLFDGLTLA